MSDENHTALTRKRSNRLTSRTVAAAKPGHHHDGQGLYLVVGSFPAQSGKALCGMALRRLMVEGTTVHGMRSAFRDWCGDKTNFPREIAEAALAHRTGDATERAYRRSDVMDKRRALMESWSGFVEDLGENVIPFRA